MGDELKFHTVDLPRPAYPFLPDEIPRDEPITVSILDDDATVLFGTGFASSGGDLLRALDPFGGPDVVVVEHGDPDHYDAVSILLEVYDDVTVAIPDADAAVLEERDVTPDVRLTHDEVRWGVRTIHAPGHTPGNMAFLHEETDTLVMGDTVVHSSSQNAAPGDWRGAFAPMKPALNADDELTRTSIGILEEYRFDTALVTHGPNVTEGPEEELQTLLADLAR